MTAVPVRSPEGELARTVELPDDIFDVQVNVPLMHQVVVAQLAAARRGTHDTKNRGEVSGGGKKPYRQKGTGRARQGSIRAPQFAGGGVVHGPTPRSYEQKTPKKMKAAALRGALSDRARDGRVHVVAGLATGAVPSTKAAIAVLAGLTDRRHVLVVAERHDELTWKGLRNAAGVHLIAPGQLNTYDVLVSDDVVFTEDALAQFLAGPRRGGRGAGVAREGELGELAELDGAGLDGAGLDGAGFDDAAEVETAPATDAGITTPAGAGVSTVEMADEVLAETDRNLLVEPADEAEGESP